ncbi:hypothetical protein L7F22_044472 [Adiantum nelumboides]|nr:hypothetical protein [Adiantum nelumboides]
MAQQDKPQKPSDVADQQAPDNVKKNRIQVSNTKKPLFFYVNLAKRFMQQYEEVELSALGMAISTVVTVVEILKNYGLASVKSKAIFHHWFFIASAYQNLHTGHTRLLGKNCTR